MGIQRLTMYKPVLQATVKDDADPKTKEAATWALTEIERDPVEATKSEAPPEVPEEGADEKSDEAPAEEAPEKPSEG
jgi:hypothetical protein